MKYSANSSENNQALFCEQVQQITNVFEQCNDCERTVVVYTLFKKLPYSNVKFLQHSINNYAKQASALPTHMTLLEKAANSPPFLKGLLQKYNSYTNFSSSSDNIDASSDSELSCNDSITSYEAELITKYVSKNDVVMDLLIYLPMLRPNNDDSKKGYIQFIPILMEDAIKYNSIHVEMVQQFLSYLLIHPAVKNEDRKPLNQWFQKICDHMNTGYSTISIAGSSYNFLSSENPSSFMSTTSSMSSVSSSSSASSTTWPTTVPQIQTTTNDIFKMKRDEFWDLRNIKVTEEFCDDLNQAKYPLPIGNNSASQNGLNSSKNTSSKKGKSNNNKNTSAVTSIFDTNDEHHISFSKNGTDVDFDNDFIDGSKNNSLTSNAPTSATNDFLTVPNFFNDRLFNDVYGYGALSSDGFSDDGTNAIKTRRSNSLTTPTASGDFSSSSAENLANLQKPRSFSLSMESSRNALMSCGSETRLDKLAQMQFNNNSHQIGMGSIAVWLKSLRLHKYLWLFTNMTYEQMMEMTEEYLENLGVTKGARHKLVLCIQKLADRVVLLKQVEKEMMDGTRPLKAGLDEIANVVLTPMKPINSVPCEEDVATHVMRVLDCSFQIMQSIKYLSNTDEESVNVFLWVLDKGLHHEAFVQQAGRLKEYKYKLQRIKMMFANKLYNGNSNNNNNKGNNMKMRWTKNKMNNQNLSDNQKNRRNSMTYFNAPPYQPNQNVGNNNNNNNNSKSLSYPNFGNTQNASNLSNFQRSASREKLNQFTLMQQQHHIQFNQPQVQNSGNNANPTAYHRNSLNSLMPYSQQQQQQQYRRNSCGMNTSSMSSPLGSNEKILNDQGLSISPNLLSMSTSLPPTTANTACDINSRLESLCRQMTEQAIN